MRVKNIIFTRIEKDDIPAGPNIEQLSRLKPLFSIKSLSNGKIHPTKWSKK